ncbi:vacuolar endopolyphosphatase-like protein [Xylogone sp. PMI_703]|nr:vacuolar endopolyphosphatase-like protein [Xylogone sp. PMI_703]
MRSLPVFLAASLLQTLSASPLAPGAQLFSVATQQPVVAVEADSRKLNGRFLHITDTHPDKYYKRHSSPDDACHRGSGVAGTYGAEGSDCDSPYALVNATFKWIEDNLKDKIDFVIWTGDSARHDSDEDIPRVEKEVLAENRFVLNKFVEVFGKDSKGGSEPELEIPIISTFGNNDILPHNILLSGPNKWLKTYTSIWSKLIPEEQRHGFERGGWYYVEVIPNKLAVFSLNTLYFFSNNAGTDGCGLQSEPGYEHMEWLRVQLAFMRQRGMKAILMGHVPPARTDSKKLWDETCWQKYTMWLKRYRDVVVGGFYGHMNIDHFMFQDTEEIKLKAMQGSEDDLRIAMEDEITLQSASDYLEELRQDWSKLPKKVMKLNETDEEDKSMAVETTTRKKHGKKGKKGKKSKKTGGPWGERYQLSIVGPSVVPNYFPTLRVVEYNITGLDTLMVWSNTPSAWNPPQEPYSVDPEAVMRQYFEDQDALVEEISTSDKEVEGQRKRKKKQGKDKKSKNPDLKLPDPPSKTSPPGPAYSPQTLTLLGYTQYYANLTKINNESNHKEKKDVDQAHKPKEFQFEVEYNTFTDEVYKLEDMTVRSYLKLAYRMGQEKPLNGDEVLDDPEADEIEAHDSEELEVDDDDLRDRKKKKKKEHDLEHEKNKVWIQFYNRAFVGTILDDANLATTPIRQDTKPISIDPHDGDL